MGLWKDHWVCGLKGKARHLGMPMVITCGRFLTSVAIVRGTVPEFVDPKGVYLSRVPAAEF